MSFRRLTANGEGAGGAPHHQERKRPPLTCAFPPASFPLRDDAKTKNAAAATTTAGTPQLMSVLSVYMYSSLASGVEKKPATPPADLAHAEGANSGGQRGVGGEQRDERGDAGDARRRGGDGAGVARVSRGRGDARVDIGDGSPFPRRGGADARVVARPPIAVTRTASRIGAPAERRGLARRATTPGSRGAARASVEEYIEMVAIEAEQVAGARSVRAGVVVAARRFEKANLEDGTRGAPRASFALTCHKLARVGSPVSPPPIDDIGTEKRSSSARGNKSHKRLRSIDKGPLPI